MQNALGLMGEQQMMIAIMVALGVAGILALFMALYWPPRWRLPYSAEVVFAVVIAALGVFGALNSQATVAKYQADVPRIEEMSVTVAIDTGAEKFDRVASVYLFQWGMLFINADGSTSRNAFAVKPGERVLIHVLANDVIHGLQIPAVRLMTEVDPGAVRSVWFRAPDKPGKYLIQCVNYCGIGHHQMKAWLIVSGDNAGDDENPDRGGEKHG